MQSAQGFDAYEFANCARIVSRYMKTLRFQDILAKSDLFADRVSHGSVASIGSEFHITSSLPPGILVPMISR